MYSNLRKNMYFGIISKIAISISVISTIFTTPYYNVNASETESSQNITSEESTEHILPLEIQDLYNKTLNYGISTNPSSPMWSEDLKYILISIANYYNLDISNSRTLFYGQNLSIENALVMINEYIPFEKGDYLYFKYRYLIDNMNLQTIYNTINADILPYDENFVPNRAFTKEMAGSVIFKLVDHIENNLYWLPKSNNENSSPIVTLNTPLNVNIPFKFNTYNTPTTIATPTGEYESRNVQLLAVKNGSWWQVNIDGLVQWIYTNNKLIYNTSYQPMYDNLYSKNIVSIVSPQVLTVLDEEDGYLKISSWLGSSWINSNTTNTVFHNTTFFTVPFDFDLVYSSSSEAIPKAIHYPSQSVQLLEMRENGYWKIKVNTLEGWINTQNKLTYIDTEKNLFNYPDDSLEPVGNINGQVVYIEQIKGDFARISTWLGYKWIRL